MAENLNLIEMLEEKLGNHWGGGFGEVKWVEASHVQDQCTRSNKGILVGRRGMGGTLGEPEKKKKQKTLSVN